MQRDLRTGTVPPTSPPGIRMTGVSASYNRGSFKALDDITLETSRTEFVSLVGPSGCGKTTLLKVAAGLIEASGEVALLGKAPAAMHREHVIGFVFQDSNLLPWRTVRQNAMLLVEAAGLSREQGHRRVDELLEAVGLSHVANFYPAQLSGGMRQRVALARTMAIEPKVLFMDEPFAALDALTRDRLGEALLTVWGHDRPVLFVTHSIPEAVFLSDRIIIMSPRPARIVGDIRIELQYPRTMETREDRKYFEYISAANRILRESCESGG